MQQPDPAFDLIRSCARHVGLTVAEVLSIASTAPKRYKVYTIPKRSGGNRVICHPAVELKALQYFFLRDVLAGLPVHECATAYRIGSSIKMNAQMHSTSRVILKIDFASFFHSIKTADWESYARLNFPHWSGEELEFSSRVMFWGQGGYGPRCLAIGAPTSPHLSNLLLYNFDVALTGFANANRWAYTRYADDITLSSREFLDRNKALDFVRHMSARIKKPSLTINEQKTRLVSKALARRVTGIVIANEGALSIGRERKRLISSMVHRAGLGILPAEERGRLRGLLAFASDVEPTFLLTLRRKYGDKLLVSLTQGE